MSENVCLKTGSQPPDLLREGRWIVGLIIGYCPCSLIPTGIDCIKKCKKAMRDTNAFLFDFNHPIKILTIHLIFFIFKGFIGQKPGGLKYCENTCAKNRSNREEMVHSRC